MEGAEIRGRRGGRPARPPGAPPARLLAATLLLALLPALLSACASIPLSTMWKLRGFDAQTLMQLDPADLRVATTLVPRVQILPDSVRLTLALSRDDGDDVRHEFALESRNQAGPDARLPWQVWALDADGRRGFADVQRALRAADAGDAAPFTGASFNVALKPEFGEDPPAVLRMTVQLQLDRVDGWFVLIDDHAIPVTR